VAIQVPPTAQDEGTSPASPITFEEFLLRADDRLMEWVDGEVLPMSPPSADHQRLRDFLLTLLRLFVERHGLGEVFGAPDRRLKGPLTPRSVVS
jgi:Uma2 family endonuclease